MESLRNLKFFILNLFIIFLSYYIFASEFNLNGVCEIGENSQLCEDCTSAYCGDNTCDLGKGENSDNCWKDCPKANGERCDFDKECLSRHFCGGSVIKFMIN